VASQTVEKAIAGGVARVELFGHTPSIEIMGAAYFIVLEREIDGLDAGMDWHFELNI
jgi:hypothetical protein